MNSKRRFKAVTPSQDDVKLQAVIKDKKRWFFKTGQKRRPASRDTPDNVSHNFSRNEDHLWCSNELKRNE